MTNADRQQAMLNQSNDMPHSPGATDPQVLQNLDRLDELLSRAVTSSPVGMTTERRQVERRSVMTKIIVIQQDAALSDQDASDFAFTEGLTLNVSNSGVAFVTAQALNGDSYLALLRHPDHPSTQCCFELTLFRSRQLADGQWEHGAVLRPLVPHTAAVAAPLSPSEV